MNNDLWFIHFIRVVEGRDLKAVLKLGKLEVGVKGRERARKTLLQHLDLTASKRTR